MNQLEGGTSQAEPFCNVGVCYCVSTLRKRHFRSAFCSFHDCPRGEAKMWLFWIMLRIKRCESEKPGTSDCPSCWSPEVKHPCFWGPAALVDASIHQWCRSLHLKTDEELTEVYRPAASLKMHPIEQWEQHEEQLWCDYYSLTGCSEHNSINMVVENLILKQQHSKLFEEAMCWSFNDILFLFYVG